MTKTGINHPTDLMINKSILKNYLVPQSKEQDVLILDLANYFEKFYYFCFELKNDNMLKGQINFKYIYKNGSSKT